MTFFANGLPISISPGHVKQIASDGYVDVIEIDESVIPTSIKRTLLCVAAEEAGFPDDLSVGDDIPIFSINRDKDGIALAVFLPATPSTFDGDSQIPLDCDLKCWSEIIGAKVR